MVASCPRVFIASSTVPCPIRQASFMLTVQTYGHGTPGAGAFVPNWGFYGSRKLLTLYFHPNLPILVFLAQRFPSGAPWLDARPLSSYLPPPLLHSVPSLSLQTVPCFRSVRITALLFCDDISFMYVQLPAHTSAPRPVLVLQVTQQSWTLAFAPGCSSPGPLILDRGSHNRLDLWCQPATFFIGKSHLLPAQDGLLSRLRPPALERLPCHRQCLHFHRIMYEFCL